jgi:hypothetical protein
LIAEGCVVLEREVALGVGRRRESERGTVLMQDTTRELKTEGSSRK